MKRLKSLSLVTENCELFTFDAKHIGRFDYSSNDKQVFWEGFVHHETVESAIIGFNIGTELLLEETTAFSLDWHERTSITMIDLVYNDNTTKTIRLDWPNKLEDRYLTEHPGQMWMKFPNGVMIFRHFNKSLPVDTTELA